MNLKEYQDLAKTTAGEFSEEERTIWTLVSALGLCGEAGEVADYLKKIYGHGHQLDYVKLKKELGDVLWYLADICTKFGVSLDEVAQLNIDKLKKRYPSGFSVEASVNRKKEDI